MEVPKGFLAGFWSFISFLPFFFSLLLLGIVKSAIVGPVVAVLILVGNSVVIICMWPAHFVWTYYCMVKTKRLGMVLKMVLLVLLPGPLILWPILGILGSLLIGIGYGFIAPLLATFEAVGEDVTNKLYHCFLDGCLESITGACTFVRDLTDFCFHSYFSYMDDLSENASYNEAPADVKLTKVPSCLLVCLLAVAVDVPMISMVALYKSPCMLLKGWQRLLEDLIGREGPFLETVCVPFAGLAILLWPLAVLGAVAASFICSFFLGLYAGVIVHQENSFWMGLAYVISIISIFDEYTNDLLYLREGSCLPRPKYRKAQSTEEALERENGIKQGKSLDNSMSLDADGKRLGSEGSRTMRKAIKQLRPIQIWDWLFSSCELNGRILLHEDLISIADLEECIAKGKCKRLSLKLPSWCILQCLLRSAKSDAYGLLISEEVEATSFNWPKDKVLEWILGPLLVIKEQLKNMEMNEDEEDCLSKLLLTNLNEKPEDWDEEFPSDDTVKRAQLQAIFRRLQGIVANMTRLPSFRRRFNDLLKILYKEAIESGLINKTEGGSYSRGMTDIGINNGGKQNKDLSRSRASSSLDNEADDANNFV